MMFRKWILVFIVFLSVSAFAQLKPKRILILFSDTGAGHDYTARAIEEMILKEDPTAIIERKNIWDFSNPALRAAKEIGYPLVLSYLPIIRDQAYLRSMGRGNEVEDLRDFESYHSAFNKKEALDYIETFDADVVLATNYSGAEILRALRQDEYLLDRYVGWVITDYATGYWPRVSKYFERTFLLHPAMEASWRKEGVSASQIAVTGLPVDPSLATPVDREAVLKKYGLRADLKTILITGGSLGQAPYLEIVKELFEAGKEFQMIAVTGDNSSAAQDLRRLIKNREGLGSKLVVTGRLDNRDYVDLIKASDLYVSKAGGRAPTEGFYIQKPMVIFSTPGGGVEQGNLQFFAENNLASVVQDQDEIASAILKLVENPGQQEKMLKEQAQFREFFQLEPIADFTLRSKPLLKRPKRVLSSARTWSTACDFPLLLHGGLP
jgi:processive 1,2-diacylglycerol beta-glucosyltransferase